MNIIYRKEILIDEINEIIFQGWEDSFDFIETTQNFNNDDFELKPEYLVTVKISDRIRRQLISTPLSNFSLKLEEKTNVVYRRCFKERTRINFPNSDRFTYKNRENKESEKRKGKIDITIYKNEYSGSDSYRTYIIIEIKNFEKRYKKIADDIIRIKELMSLSDSLSENSCNYGILTFSLKLSEKDLKDALYYNKLDRVINKKKEKIITQLESHGIEDIIINIKAKPFVIDHESGLHFLFLFCNIFVSK